MVCTIHVQALVSWRHVPTLAVDWPSLSEGCYELISIRVIQ